MALAIFSLLVIITLHCCEGEPKWRNLSEVSYYFTTCNGTGANGTTYQSCLQYYQSINSPIQQHLTDDSETLGFFGGQTFTFPRSGTYNVTIAGASGGRGLCNVKTSRGVILQTQLLIDTQVNGSVLVLVGHRGIGPCDSNSSYKLCTDPPTNLTEANECLSMWNTESLPSLKSRLGGGGGGGGSMIWPRNSSGHYSQSILPFIVAAGGGGTSLQTSYNAILNAVNGNVEQLRVGNETNEELYQRFIDGRPSYTDSLIDNIGGTGMRPGVGGESMSFSSGAGSGWFSPPNMKDIDGQLLSKRIVFARGGLDCVLGLGSDNTGLPFKRVNGGFGGGGGSCDSGGGGGGFGGGEVLKSSPEIPGGGGYSLLTINNTRVNSTSSGMNDGDGYVNIVLGDCGCMNGCRVNGELYQCICLEPTILANNGLDCISTNSNYSDFTTTERAEYRLLVSDTTLSYSLLQFNNVLTLYGGSVTFERKETEERRRRRETRDEPMCLIVWLSDTNVPVLISDSANGSLRVITNLTNGSVGDPLYTLSDGLMVSGGILIGNCIVTNITLSASTTVEGTVNIDPMTVVSNYNNFFQSIVMNVLLPSTIVSSSSSLFPSPSIVLSTITQAPSSFITTSMTPTVITEPGRGELLTNNIIIAIAVAAAAILFLVVIVIIVIIICVVKRKRGIKVYQIHSSTDNDSKKRKMPVTPEEHQLEKLRFKLSSLKRNPNYGVGMSGEEEIDYSGKVKLAPKDLSSDIENGYTPMSFERGTDEGSFETSIEQRPQPYRLRSRSSRRKTFTLKPKFGVMSPSVTFYEYNKDRADDDWEHDRSQLTYLRDIGEGQFGKVLLMKAKNIAGYKGKLPVAVKTLTSIEDEDVQKFLEEIELMKKFSNPHIVSLLGISTGGSEGAPLMILEYMPYGDLHNFLLKHKPKAGEHAIIGIYHQIRFAGDIANAMAFLESNKYVHRDIAARNCLVGPNLEVKVADFGMARIVQEKEYYKIAGRAVLPVRWMAPESLIYGYFTSSSDVWSYGVLLWEIATYGTVPLESSSVQEIVEMAQNKTLYHTWPEKYLPELKVVQEECHKYEAEERITFENIASLLPNSQTTT